MSTNADLFHDQQGLITRLAQDNGLYQGYLAELQEAWKVADAVARFQLRQYELPSSFATCIRYALIYSTIVGNLSQHVPLPSVYNGTATTSSVETLEALRDAMNTMIQAPAESETLASAAEIDDPNVRAQVLLDLAERLPIEERPPVIRAIFESMLEIQDSYWEFPRHLWSIFADFLESGQLGQYTHVIFSTSNEVAAAWFIDSFVGRMTPILRREARRWALRIHDPLVRVFTLRILLPRSRGKQRAKILNAMYRAAEKMTDAWAKSKILVELLDKLDDARQQQTIQQVVKLIPQTPGPSRAWEAARLLPYLTPDKRDDFLQNILNAGGARYRTEAALTLWTHLSKQARQQSVTTALEVQAPEERAIYLARIAQKLRSKNMQQAIVQHIRTAILAIRNEDKRRAAIQEVQGKLHHPAIDEIVNVPVEHLTPDFERMLGYRFAFAERDARYIAYALGNLSPFMTKTRKNQAMGLMVDIAIEIDLHDYVAEAIEEIAPYLDEFYLGKALDGAIQIDNGWSRVWALSGLLPYLKGKRRKLCLDKALIATGFLDKRAANEGWIVVDMAARLLPHLKGRVRERVLTIGLAAAETNDREDYDARIRFLPYLADERKEALAIAILNDIPTLTKDAATAHTLSAIAPHLPVSFVQAGVEHAQVIRDANNRENALAALIPFVLDLGKQLKSLDLLESPYNQAGVLIAMLDRCDGEVRATLLERVIKTIETIESGLYRTFRWIELARHIEHPDEIRRRALEELLDNLWEEKGSRRNMILSLCADPQWFSPSILPVEVLRDIGEHVIQICMEWKWGKGRS